MQSRRLPVIAVAAADAAAAAASAASLPAALYFKPLRGQC